jgi:hypothetical protein
MKVLPSALLMVFTLASFADAVSINFDNGVEQAPVGAFYSGLGVTFSNTKWRDNFGRAGSSGPLGIAAINGAGGEFQPDINTPLVAVFSPGIRTVSIDAIDVGEHGARIDAYDAPVGGNLIDFDQAFGPGVGVGFFFTLTADTPTIRRIELYQPRQNLGIGDGLLWDDLSFELVPEPTTCLMAVLGAVGIAGFRRRRAIPLGRHFTDRRDTRKYLSIAVFMICLCASTAGAVVIDFETYPGPDGQLGTPDDIPIVAPALFNDQPVQITDQFQSVGIRFLPNPPQQNKNEILNDSTFTRTAGSRVNLLSTSRSSFAFGPIEAQFTVPVYELTMAIGLGSSSSVQPNRLEIFDADSNMIDSVVASDAFVTLSSAVPIDRFRVTATVSANQAAIDDIEFNPVPEPVTWLLGLAGAAWLLTTRRCLRM